MKLILVLYWCFLFLGCHHLPNSLNRSPNEAQKLIELSLDDEYKWLVERNSTDVLKWIKENNAQVDAKFSQLTDVQILKARIYKNLISKDQLHIGFQMGEFYYQIYKGESNQNGTLRRMTMNDLKLNKNIWEKIFNSDQLIKNGVNLVLTDVECLEPENSRCLFSFSLDGSDDVVVKEFDIDSRKFIQDGFNLDVPFKTKLRWVSFNEVDIITDIDKTAVTQSSYGSKVRRWKRGHLIQDSETLFEIPKNYLGVFFMDLTQNPEISTYIVESEFKKFQFYSRGPSGVRKIEGLPAYVRGHGVVQNFLVLTLLEDAFLNNTKFKKNELIAIDLKLHQSKGIVQVSQLLSPTDQSIVDFVLFSKNYIWVSELVNLKSRLRQIDPSKKDHNIEFTEFKETVLQASSANQTSDQIFVISKNLLTPDQLFLIDRQKSFFIQQKSPRFDTSELMTELLIATSKDGTKIPYLIVRKKNLIYDSKSPVLMYGYGAGNYINSDFYLNNAGLGWLDTGGIYVNTYLRGGGEFGADWRNQGFREFKQNTFDDMIAVIEDLIKRKMTSPGLVGIYGSSWGGLLVAAVMNQRPELLGAVVCSDGMLDMVNYPLLPIGESWIGEFGNPTDPAFNKILNSYSPYHTINPLKKYPPILFMNSTNDDRMHPAHGRRMAAKMRNMQKENQHIYYYESNSGGHSGATSADMNAKLWALRFGFMRYFLKNDK